MAFDLSKPIEVNGTIYEPVEFTPTKLFIHGVEPTDFESYTYCNMLAQHRNVKQTSSGHKAGGNAQANYLYHVLDDLNKFHEHKYPYYINVMTVKTSDKKGKIVDMVVQVDFDSVEEIELVSRKKAVATPTTPSQKAN